MAAEHVADTERTTAHAGFLAWLGSQTWSVWIKITLFVVLALAAISLCVGLVDGHVMTGLMDTFLRLTEVRRWPAD